MTGTTPHESVSVNVHHNVPAMKQRQRRLSAVHHDRHSALPLLHDSTLTRSNRLATPNRLRYNKYMVTDEFGNEVDPVLEAALKRATELCRRYERYENLTVDQATLVTLVRYVRVLEAENVALRGLG